MQINIFTAILQPNIFSEPAVQLLYKSSENVTNWIQGILCITCDRSDKVDTAFAAGPNLFGLTKLCTWHAHL